LAARDAHKGEGKSGLGPYFVEVPRAPDKNSLGPPVVLNFVDIKIKVF